MGRLRELPWLLTHSSRVCYGAAQELTIHQKACHVGFCRDCCGTLAAGDQRCLTDHGAGPQVCELYLATARQGRDSAHRPVQNKECAVCICPLAEKILALRNVPVNQSAGNVIQVIFCQTRKHRDASNLCRRWMSRAIQQPGLRDSSPAYYCF